MIFTFKKEYFLRYQLCSGNIFTSKLQPGVPSGVHPAQVVRRVSCGDESADLTLSAVKGGQARQLLRDDSDGFGHEVYNDVSIAIFGLLLAAVSCCSRRGRKSVNVLFVPSDHLVTQNGA